MTEEKNIPSWEDIENDSRYLNASQATQNAMKEKYYSQYVEPKAVESGLDVEGIKKEFYNRVNFPKPQETTEYVKKDEHPELKKDEDNYLDDVLFTQEELNSFKDNPIGFFDAFDYFSKEDIPLYGTYETGKYAYKAYNVIKKMKEGMPFDELPEEDRDTIVDALRQEREMKLRGITLGGHIVKGVGQSLSFAADLALTSGVTGFGKMALKKSIKEAVKKSVKQTAKMAVKTGITQAEKKVARKLGAETAKKQAIKEVAFNKVQALTLSPVFLPSAYKTFGDRQLMNGLSVTDKGQIILSESAESPLKSALMAYTGTAAEVASEMTGGVIAGAVSKIASPITKSATKYIPEPIKQAVYKGLKAIKPSESVSKLFSRAGWNGFIGEYGEEELGNMLQVGISRIGGDLTNDQALDALKGSADERIARLGIIGTMSGVSTATSLAYNTYMKNRTSKKTAKQIVNYMSELEKEKQALNNYPDPMDYNESVMKFTSPQVSKVMYDLNKDMIDIQSERGVNIESEDIIDPIIVDDIHEEQNEKAQELSDVINTAIETGKQADKIKALNSMGNRIEFNVATFRDKESLDYLKKNIVKYSMQEGLTEDDAQRRADDIVNFMEDIAKQTMEVVQGRKNALDWQLMYPTMGVNEKGEVVPVVSSFKKNAEYPINHDLSTLCVKREALDALITQLIDKGYGGNIGSTQMIALRNLLQAKGYMVACQMCFVEGKRLKMLNYANRFARSWESIRKALGITDDSPVGTPREFTPEQIQILKEMSAHGIGKRKGKHIIQEAWQKYIPEEDKVHFSDIAQTKKTDTGTAPELMSKIASVMLKDARLLGKFTPEWLLSSRGTDYLEREFYNTGIRGLLGGMYGTATPKPIEGMNIYHTFGWKEFDPNQEKFIKSRQEMIFNIGGSRAQSFSDFNAIQAFDMFQLFMDHAIRRLPMQLYTKVPELLDLYGNNGAMYNMSILHIADKNVDAEHAGLRQDENGNWVYAYSNETFGTYKNFVNDQAYESYVNGYRNRYRTVGTTAVGLSSAHIRKMLDDEFIDMIIPLHKSGMGEEDQKRLNISKAMDFSYQQTTKKYDMGNRSYAEVVQEEGYKNSKTVGTKDVKKNERFNFNEEIQKLHRQNPQWGAREAADAYLAWCKEHGFTPKFPEFAEHPNYYKLLADFKSYDSEGNPVIQQAISTKPNMENFKTALESALDTREPIIESYKSMLQDKAMLAEIEKIMKPQRLDGHFRNAMMDRLNTALGGNVETLGQDDFFDKMESDLTETYGEETAKEKVEVFRKQNGEVYGYAKGNQIVLNENTFNANTPAHEFTHIWAKVARAKNSKLWQEGVALLQKSDEWEKVKNDPLYWDIRDDENAIASEVLARYAGKENERFVESLYKDKRPVPTAKDTLTKRIMEFIHKLWEEVRSIFDEFNGKPLTFDEFVQMPLRDLWDDTRNKAFYSALKETENENIEFMLKKMDEEMEMKASVDAEKADAITEKNNNDDTSVINPFMSNAKNLISDGLNKFVYQYVNQKRQLESLGKDIKISIRNFYGIVGTIKANLESGIYEYDEKGNLVKTGKSFKNILDDFDNTVMDIESSKNKRLSDFADYLIAQRYIEDLQNREDVTVTEEQVDKSLSDLAKLQQKYGDKFRWFDEFSNELYDYQKKILHRLVDSGNMTEEQFEEITSKNKHYVPFNRVIDEEGNFIPPKGKFTKAKAPVKKIKGSEKEIKNVFQNIVDNVSKVISVSERNKIAKQIADALVEVGEAEKVSPIIQKKGTAQIKVDGETIEKDVWGVSPFEPKGTMTVYENGKRTFYKVFNQDILKEIEDVDHNVLDYVIKLIKAPSTLLRRGATEWNPDFIFRNPLRDIQTAFTQSTLYKPQDAFKIPSQWIKAMFDVVRGTDLYNERIAAGGGFETFMGQDEKGINKNFLQIYEGLFNKDSRIYDKINPFYWVSKAGEVAEQTTRQMIFNEAKRQGYSSKEASFMSRDTTLDFAVAGKTGKLYNQVIPFLNAGIRASATMFSKIAENPKLFVTKALITQTIPSILMAGYYLYGADDEDRKEYLELPQWRRHIFWNFKIGDTWWAFPKAFALSEMFATPIELAMIGNYEGEDKPEAKNLFLDTLQGIYGSLSPIGDIGSIMPVAIKLAIEQASNYNFFTGRRIYPEYMDNYVPSMRTNKSTPETYNVLGKKLNVSPARLEHISRSILGGTSRYITDVGDKMIEEFRAWNGEKTPSKPFSMSDVWVIRGFVTRTPVGYNSQSVQNFYDSLKESKQMHSSYNKLQGKEKQTFAKDNKQALKNYEMLKPFDKSMKSLRKEYDSIMSNKKLDRFEKRDKINEVEKRMTDLARKANNLLKKKK